MKNNVVSTKEVITTPFKFQVPLNVHCAFHLSHLSCMLKGPDPIMALYWMRVLGAVPLGCTVPGPEPAPSSLEGWHTPTSLVWAIC